MRQGAQSLSIPDISPYGIYFPCALAAPQTSSFAADFVVY
jgi:hypothetical protein